MVCEAGYLSVLNGLVTATSTARPSPLDHDGMVTSPGRRPEMGPASSTRLRTRLCVCGCVCVCVCVLSLSLFFVFLSLLLFLSFLLFHTTVTDENIPFSPDRLSCSLTLF